MSINEAQFETLAQEILEDFLDKIEDVLGDDVEADLEGGILSVELEDGRQFLLNKHAPNRQLWLSSPISGALHFGYSDENTWQDTRGTGTLADIFARDLSEACGVPVSLV